jgi:hypothetical protein
MLVQPQIVLALLQIRDRELRQRADRAARHAELASQVTPVAAPRRHPAPAPARTAPAGR